MNGWAPLASCVFPDKSFGKLHGVCRKDLFVGRLTKPQDRQPR